MLGLKLDSHERTYRESKIIFRINNLNFIPNIDTNMKMNHE